MARIARQGNAQIERACCGSRRHLVEDAGFCLRPRFRERNRSLAGLIAALTFDVSPPVLLRGAGRAAA